MHLFITSGEWPKIARKELEVIIQGNNWTHNEQISTCTETKVQNISHLALCKEAHEVLSTGNEEEIPQWCKEHPHNTNKKIRIGWKNVDGTHARSTLIDWLGTPAVDLENPKEEYYLIADKQGKHYLTKKIWANTENWNKRKSHNRAAPHPTATHPKLARAMINLSRAQEEILDPFCGAAGILLEGALLELQVTGIDIDPIMIRRAQMNLEQYNCTGKLIEADAREWEEKSEVIVTDLPYGRNSKAENLEELYAAFLEQAQKICEKMVVAFPDSVAVDELIKNNGWKEEAKFIIPLHRSLRKIICMLTQKN